MIDTDNIDTEWLHMDLVGILLSVPCFYPVHFFL
jgi:hypothetical protein